MASKPASAYIYAFLDALLTKRKTKLVFGFVGVGMWERKGRDEGNSHCVGGVSWAWFLWGTSVSVSPESKSDFTKECPLRGYDNRKEDWPKCMHGEDCLVQMFTEGIDGGRRFFKCPQAWVIAITFRLLNMFLEYPYNSWDILIVVFRVRRKLWVY